MRAFALPRRAFQHGLHGVDAVGTRQRQCGARLLLDVGRGVGQHAAERVAFVAQGEAALHDLEVVERHAVRTHRLEHRGRALRRIARRRAPRQALGDHAQRIERLGADGLSGRGLQVGGDIRDAQRFGAGCVAQEAHHRQQLRRLRRVVERDAPYLRHTHVAGALAAVVVHLQVVEALATHLEQVARRQACVLCSIGLGCCSQRRLVERDDRE